VWYAVSCSVTHAIGKLFVHSISLFQLFSIDLIAVAVFFGVPPPLGNLCGAQAHIITYFFPAAVLLFLMLAVNIWRTIACNDKHAFRRLRLFYFGIAFGIPIIFLIVLASHPTNISYFSFFCFTTSVCWVGLHRFKLTHFSKVWISSFFACYISRDSLYRDRFKRRNVNSHVHLYAKNHVNKGKQS
jgi:hypothetical protein